jgi:hypothetical protein
MQSVGTPAVYHPRKPRQSPLWQLLNDHYHDFELNYDERRVCQYGYPRRVVSEVVYDYLKCGDLREGFARIRYLSAKAISYQLPISKSSSAPGLTGYLHCV